MIRRAAGALLLLAVTGCASTGGEGSKPSWAGLGGKGGEVILLAGLKPGGYEPSILAVGEEKDLARYRGDSLGFVRSAALEQYLNEVRERYPALGKTGVPGRW